jgi:hypothetical protein
VALQVPHLRARLPFYSVLVNFKDVGTLRFLVTFLFIKKIKDHLGIHEVESLELFRLNSDLFSRKGFLGLPSRGR